MRTLFLVLAFLLGLAQPSDAKRIALVMGNGTYAHAGLLTNPPNDARDVGAALSTLGFDVKVVVDADLGAMQSAVKALARDAEGADVVLAYYAGHGIEISGQNYLIPVDAKLAEALDAPKEALALDTVMREVFAHGKFRLIVLDACRDSPFAGSLRQRDGGIRRGLAEPATFPENMLVAYAAKAGTVAQDGPPGGNSPFTSAFLKALQTPKQDVRLLLRNVLTDVMQATQFQQAPFTYGNISAAEIHLNQGSTSR
jgi:uncharacterized caspase-like protein